MYHTFLGLFSEEFNPNTTSTHLKMISEKDVLFQARFQLFFFYELRKKKKIQFISHVLQVFFSLNVTCIPGYSVDLCEVLSLCFSLLTRRVPTTEFCLHQGGVRSVYRPQL